MVIGESLLSHDICSVFSSLVESFFCIMSSLLIKVNGEDVTVDLPQAESAESAASASAVHTPKQQKQKFTDAPDWTAWHDSAFRGMSKNELEPQLNLRLRKLSVNRDRVKSRNFQNFQFEFDVRGSRC